LSGCKLNGNGRDEDSMSGFCYADDEQLNEYFPSKKCTAVCS